MKTMGDQTGTVVHPSDWIHAHAWDRRTFRNMLGSFMTGVTVVATRDRSGEPKAFTANSFTSVSLDPPLILVCIAKSAGSFEAFQDAERFSVNVLGDWQRDVANAFASRGAEKSKALADLAMDHDTPVLDSSLVTMVCESDRRIEAGDHVILIGRVAAFRFGAGQPLGYFRGGYVMLGLAERSLETSSVPLIVGGLLEHKGRIVLCRRPGASHFEIPSAPLNSGDRHTEVVRSIFARLGVSAMSSLLYSVFQEQGDAHTTMVFRVEPSAPINVGTLSDGTEIASFGEDDAPWTLVKGAMMQGMLVRFFREHAAGNFGLYCDTEDGGRVAAIESNARHWTQWSPEQSRLPRRR